ncbi:hypothetical protein [Neobacillus notoginsengisoli]|uniref:hypothetical protein n=1 Tax=Neobacillus notoginsengisoli TaxID=1578198 RepID=UPI00115CC2AA|nr:hypothetical protein [Neobacillus notoginsengisoli]
MNKKKTHFYYLWLMALVIAISEPIIKTIVLTPYVFLFLGAACLVGGISQFKEVVSKGNLN